MAIEQFSRWIECQLQQAPGCPFRYADFILGYGQTSLGDMEDPFGGSTIAFWIVQDALSDPIRIDDVGGEAVLGRRQREGSRQTVAIEHKRPGR